jgi:SAM-dependent methyltransferase
VYVNPQLLASEIVRIYEIGYASKTVMTPPKVDPLTHRRELAFARPYRREGRWLDVGCFNGNLLLTARSDGWEPFGTEISSPAVRYARGQGIEVFEGDLPAARFPDNFFDVVTMMDVIEHLDEPLRYLNEVRRILRVGGGLYMDTPNFNSLVRYVLGREWSVFFPWHQYYFTARTMRIMLDKADLRCKRIECIGLSPLSRYNPLLSLRENGEIAQSSRRGLKSMLRQRTPFLRRWYFAAQDVGNLPFRLLSAAGIHIGSKMIVMAEKDS